MPAGGGERSELAPQAAQVLKWLQLNGYSEVRAQLLVEIEKRDVSEAPEQTILREVEGACLAPDFVSGWQGEVAAIIATLITYSCGVLAGRGELSSAKRAFEHLTNLALRFPQGTHPEGLAAMREMLHRTPNDFATRHRSADLITQLAPLRSAKDYLERHRATFLLGVLCDPFKVRTSVVKTSASTALHGDEPEPSATPTTPTPLRAEKRRRLLPPPDDQQGDGPSILLHTLDFACPADFSDSGWDALAPPPPAHTTDEPVVRRRARPAPLSGPTALLAASSGPLLGIYTPDAAPRSAPTGGDITAVRFSSGPSPLLFTADDKGSVKLWSDSALELCRYSHAQGASVMSFDTPRVAPSVFLCGMAEPYVSLWSTEHTASPVRLFSLGSASPSHSAWVTTVRFCSVSEPEGGHSVVSTDSTMSLRCWDVRSAAPAWSEPLNPTEGARVGGTRGSPRVTEVFDSCVSPCGGYVCLGVETSSDAAPYQLRVFDTRGGGAVASLPVCGAPLSLSHHPDDPATLAVACSSLPAVSCVSTSDAVCVVRGYSSTGPVDRATPAQCYPVDDVSLFATKWASDGVLLCAGCPEGTSAL